MTEVTMIYGAGGHGRVLLDIARASGVKIDFFSDDQLAGKSVEGVPVISMKEISQHPAFRFLVGIGDNNVRTKLFGDLSRTGSPFTLIHPFTSISPGARLGRGTVAMPGAVVNIGATIGENVILNTSCSIDHDCRIESHSHIAPGVHLAAAITVGAGTFIGAGSSVIPGITIGENCVIGAGSVVVRDIPANSKAYGVPARPPQAPRTNVGLIQDQ
jgi:sugar O-acyltransferase (sialic acid O-acetyltransferase NeuD family)